MRARSSQPSGLALAHGYARVVVPARPGFETAMSYFVENAEVYGGEGGLDMDNPLYQSITDEVKPAADRVKSPSAKPEKRKRCARAVRLSA